MANARLGAALRSLREKKRMSLRALEKPVGLSFTTIGDRERGLGRDLDDEELDAYLKAVGATRKDLEREMGQVVVPTRITDTIPLLPTIASAGRAWLDRGDAQDFPDGTKQVPRGRRATHPAAFAVTVEGTSMQPLFQPGDIIVCEPIEDEEDADRLQDGRVVVAWTHPAVGQSQGKAIKPPDGLQLIPPAGFVGRWEWRADRSAVIRKDNGHHQAVWIPAVHDGRVFLAVVAEFTRAV
jgi:transcriptional regulator with XRE-family HTH domain